MKILNDIAKTGLAAIPLTSSATLGTPIDIDASGYGRCRFTFNFGVPLAGASFYAIVYQGTSSAGYVSNPNAVLTLMTSGNSSCQAIIDMQVSSGQPHLILSGSGAINSNWPLSISFDLYQGMNRSRQTTAAGAAGAPVQIVIA
jgi:hypothetical protein